MPTISQLVPERWTTRTFRVRLCSTACYVAGAVLGFISVFPVVTISVAGAVLGAGLAAILVVAGEYLRRTEALKELSFPKAPKSPPVVWSRSNDE